MEWNLEDYKLYCISIFGSLAMHLSTMHEVLQVMIGGFTAIYTGIKAYKELKKIIKSKDEKTN